MTQPKAKRVIKDINFSGDESHIALVHKDQGGPANNAAYKLVMKSKSFSPEFIQKAHSIQVTLSIPEFLDRFFNIWGSDAAVLANLMGYQPKEDDTLDRYDSDESYDKWLDNKINSFVILKSLKDAKNLPLAISKLTEDQYLDVLNDQAIIEKALKKLTDGDKPKEDTSTVSVETKAENQNEVTSSAKTKKEPKMTKAVKDENKDSQEDNQAVETVQKSVVVDLEKALNDQKVQLQKALDQVKQYEDIQKASVVRNKTDAITALVKDETKTEALVKAGLALESQVDFDAYVQVIKSLVEQLDSSEMFVEKGVSGTAKEEKAPESSLTALIKSKFNK